MVLPTMDNSKEQRTQVSAFQRDFLLANSSISKDKTGGKKAEEDDSLRVLSSNMEKFAEMRNRVSPESSDESDVPPNKSLSRSSSEESQQSQTSHYPMQTTEAIPWHTSTLSRPVKNGKKQKVKNSDQSSAGKQNIGTPALGDSNGADHQETVKGEGGEKVPAKVCHLHTRRSYTTPASSVLIRIITLVPTIPF